MASSSQPLEIVRGSSNSMEDINGDFEMQPNILGCIGKTSGEVQSVSKEDDVLSLSNSDGQNLSQSSTGSHGVTNGQLQDPNLPADGTCSGPIENSNSNDGLPGNKSRKKKKKNICGSEKKRRRRARQAEVISGQNDLASTEDQRATNKRGRSPGSKGKLTPPSKRAMDTTPNENRQSANYRQAVSSSMTFYIVGVDKALNSDQVGAVLGNIVWELEKFIGSGTMAPSFNGNRQGESELELECADDRTVRWLFSTVPKLRPFKEPALKIITQLEWEAAYKPKRMMRMSVIVPWETTPAYFMQVLRSNNPFLKTRYWEVKHVENWGERTKICLKVDDTSVDMLKERNFKAFWLLNVIKFKLERTESEKECERAGNDIGKVAENSTSKAATSTSTSELSTVTTALSTMTNEAQAVIDLSSEVAEQTSAGSVQTVRSPETGKHGKATAPVAMASMVSKSKEAKGGVADYAVRGRNTVAAKSVHSNRHSKRNQSGNRWVWASQKTGTSTPNAGGGKAKPEEGSRTTGGNPSGESAQ